ncbi:hypothetical protein GOB24_32665 [Sinorhizobium meliloti]|nr:hypothetical protein [Sinorhizobium meliloti]
MDRRKGKPLRGRPMADPCPDPPPIPEKRTRSGRAPSNNEESPLTRQGLTANSSCEPQTALSRWFHDRVRQNGGRFKKVMITALARKLLVAVWKYVTQGVDIEGMAMTTA